MSRFCDLILAMLFAWMLSSCNNSRAVISFETVDVNQLVTAQGITSKNGKPFSGNAFALDSKQDTIALDIYAEGKLHGLCKAWFSDGRIMQERWYQNGRKVGIHRGWWPNGKLKFQYSFKDDEYDGKVLEWYESGVPAKSFTYALGYESGPQQMWRMDGSVYANYFVKKNRIYGLSGRKNCKDLSKT